MDGADSTSLTEVIMTGQLWIFYILCALAGGLASSLVNNKGGLLKFQSKKELFIIGPLSDMVIGVVAALAILQIITPVKEIQVFSIGAIAGYGGSSILQSLVNKIQSTINAHERETAVAQRETAIAEKGKALSDKEFLVSELRPLVSEEKIKELRGKGIIS